MTRGVSCARSRRGAARQDPGADWDVTHVANVAWPTPGLCFRMVYSGFNGYPTCCPVTPEWRGTFVNPKGSAGPSRRATSMWEIFTGREPQ